MAEKAVITTSGTIMLPSESTSLQLMVYCEMTPLVGSGCPHVAERLLEDPVTIERVKFLGAEGTG